MTQGNRGTLALTGSSLDAAGIRMLLDADARSKGKGRRLQITRAASAQVQRVLDLTGVGEVLSFAA